MPPLAIAAGIGTAVAGVGGAAIAAHGAGKAADTQAQTALDVAQMQKQSGDEALQQNQDQFITSQNELAPYYLNGVSANANLANLLGVLSPEAASQQVFNPATDTKLTPISAMPGNVTPGSKPPWLSQREWDSLGKWQQIAINHPGADVSAGILQSGSRPDDFSAAMWAKTPQAIKDSLMNVGKPYQAPTIGGSAGSAPGGAASGQTVGSLVNPSLGASGSLLQPFGEQWQAPTAVTEQNDPGYQFRLEQGMKALQRSAAAKGNLLTGGTLKSLTDYNQNAASGEYGNVYNRALNDYQTRYNAYNQGQTDKYNRLAALSGTGQTTAQQLSANGLNFGQNAGNILQQSAAQQGQQLNNAAAATASGYVGSGNAYGNALGGIGSNIMQMLLLKNLYGSGGIGTGSGNAWSGGFRG